MRYVKHYVKRKIEVNAIGEKSIRMLRRFWMKERKKWFKIKESTKGSDQNT